ncbi:MAG: hypothetical protein D6790_08115 [Caldilineae bacterium]|nr:MAG: hypothetical protein D6790_08115 [Caldilineae bacterium]
MANGFSDTALHVIVSNHENKKTIDVVALKPKVVGEERRYALDDLALLTGATVLGRGFTPQPRSAKPEHLGKAIRVEVDAETVRMIPERQRAVAVQEEITAIREKLANMPHGEEERTVLVNRLSALTGGMATLKVGATSKHEREVQAQNAERALKVLSAAQIGGVVPGGGAALFHAGMDLNGSASGGEAMGAQVIRSGLAAPLRQMLVNAHVPAPGVVLEDLEAAGPNAVYDILQGRIMDAEACGVLDAARVLENVLRMSASVAIMALSTDTIVYHRKPEQVMEP